MYIHFTKEEKERANEVDLVEFLKAQGEKLLSSGKEKRLSSDHSITVRDNTWYDHSSNSGGLAIDFVKNFYKISFPEAVTLLLGGNHGTPYINVVEKEEEKILFELPPRNNDMRRTFAYLIKQRYIASDVITFFAKEKSIYESLELSKSGEKEYHNAIFVGYDKNGIAFHAHKKGLNTKGKSFKGNISSSNPKYSFHHIGTSDTLYVFEAPIDMLSFITMNKDKEWKEDSYVSLCGLSEKAMMHQLENNPNITQVALCLDNDAAGNKACEKFENLLNEKNFNCFRIKPVLKDFNEDLKENQLQNQKQSISFTT